MKSLDHAIAALAHELHPDIASSIVMELEKRPQEGILNVLRSSLGGTSKEHLAAFEKTLAHDDGVSSRDIAFMIRGAAAAVVQNNCAKIELVWTGPNVGIVPVRRTEQVLAGVIDGSRQKLFIVSFVAYDADQILKAIIAATARGVQVRILMERGKAEGGVLNFDAISKVRSLVPAAEFYTWNGENIGLGSPGSVHAKCAVADGETAFITSANLTSAAMERNMEVGTLVSGGEVPQNLQKHLEALVVTRKITRMSNWK